MILSYRTEEAILPRALERDCCMFAFVRAFKYVKGYSCGKLALMEGNTWILSGDTAERKECFLLYIPFLPSHISLFQVFWTEFEGKKKKQVSIRSTVL